MLTRTPSDQVLLKPSLDPEVRTANANGASVDRRGFERALMLLHVGAHDRADTNETLTVKVQESADDSTWTDITGASVQIAGDTIDATKGLIKSIEIDLSDPARKQYLRAVGTVGGTTPSTAYSVAFLLFSPATTPLTQDVAAVKV